MCLQCACVCECAHVDVCVCVILAASVCVCAWWWWLPCVCDASLQPAQPAGARVESHTLCVFSSSRQVDACALNFAFQETSVGIHYNAEDGAPVELLDYVRNKDVFAVDAEGHMALPRRPGLGVDVDEDKVRAMAAHGHRWRDREWQLDDGTPTTW